MPRVLLADDDDAFREQLAEELRTNVAGLEIVASVGDGHQAVAQAMTHSPDTVLIDYGMPGPDGGHAAAVIRQALPATRVVILTGQETAKLENVPPDVEVLRKGAGLESALSRLFLA
ncbi:MAG TPA: response regulator transcription factor [Gaiellaceae bacterium]